jgi:hypothetical protein
MSTAQVQFDGIGDDKVRRGFFIGHDYSLSSLSSGFDRLTTTGWPEESIFSCHSNRANFSDGLRTGLD